MTDSFDSLCTLDFLQKRDLLKLLAAVIDAARTQAKRKIDVGDKSNVLSAINDLIGLEALYYEITDKRAALERDHSIPVIDLIEPALCYCNSTLS